MATFTNAIHFSTDPFEIYCLLISLLFDFFLGSLFGGRTAVYGWSCFRVTSVDYNFRIMLGMCMEEMAFSPTI